MRYHLAKYGEDLLIEGVGLDAAAVEASKGEINWMMLIGEVAHG